VLRAIAVGTRDDQQDLVDFIAERQISLKILVDRVFTFEESPEAFEYLHSGSHVGKVVIRL